MPVTFHPHAIERIIERGATAEEIIESVENGEGFPAKFGRTGFRKISCLTRNGIRDFMQQNKLKRIALKKIMNGW